MHKIYVYIYILYIFPAKGWVDILNIISKVLGFHRCGGGWPRPPAIEDEPDLGPLFWRFRRIFEGNGTS